MYNRIGRLGDTKSAVIFLVASLLAVACGETTDRPDNYTEDTAAGISLDVVDACASPKEGCPCSVPGEIIDCGQVTVKVDDYVTCFEGSRLCDAAGNWGGCEPDQVIADSSRQVSGLLRK